MNKYLVIYREEELEDAPPVIISAENKDAAIETFIRRLGVLDETFRDYVLGVDSPGALPADIVTSSDEESEDESLSAVEYDRRIMAFFSENTKFGADYLHFIKSGDRSRVTEEMLEFIALQLGAEWFGLTAVLMDDILELEFAE